MIIIISALIGLAFLGGGWALARSKPVSAEEQSPADGLIEFIISGAKSIQRDTLKKSMVVLGIIILPGLVAKWVFGDTYYAMILPMVVGVGVGIVGINSWVMTMASATGVRRIYEALHTSAALAKRKIAVLSVSIGCMTMGSLLTILSGTIGAILLMIHLHLNSQGQLEMTLEAEIIVAIMALGLGTTLVVAFMRISSSVFGKVADLTADSVGRTEYDLLEDDLRNPASIADLVGDISSKGMGMGLVVYECVLFCVVSCIAMSLIALDQFHLMGEASALKVMAQPVLILACGGVLSTVVIVIQNLMARPQRVWELALATYVLLCGCVWGVERVGGVTEGTSVLVMSGCVLGMVLILNHRHVVSRSSQLVERVMTAFDAGAVSGFLKGLLGGIMASILPIIGVALSIAFTFGVSGGFQELLSGFSALSIAIIAMMSPVPLWVALGVVGGVADNVRGVSEMVMADEEMKQRAKQLDVESSEDSALVKSMTSVAGMMSCLIVLIFLIKRVMIDIAIHSKNGIVKLGEIHVSHTASTDDVTINIAELTIQKLTHLLDLSVMHPDVILGLFLGAIVVMVMTGIVIGAVQSGVAKATDTIRAQMASKPGIWTGEMLPEYHEIINHTVTHALKWARLILGVSIVIPIISLLTIELDGTIGLLLGMISTGMMVSLVSNYAGSLWQMAKKKMELEDPTHANSSRYLASIFVDGIGDVLKDSVAPSLYMVVKTMAIISLIFSGIVLYL